MRKFKLTHFYGAGMGMLLTLMLAAGLSQMASAGGEVWDGYAQPDCRIFVMQYPSQDDACDDSAIIESCNVHLSERCENCR